MGVGRWWGWRLGLLDWVTVYWIVISSDAQCSKSGSITERQLFLSIWKHPMCPCAFQTRKHKCRYAYRRASIGPNTHIYTKKHNITSYQMHFFFIIDWGAHRQCQHRWDAAGEGNDRDSFLRNSQDQYRGFAKQTEKKWPGEGSDKRVSFLLATRFCVTMHENDQDKAIV